MKNGDFKIMKLFVLQSDEYSNIYILDGPPENEEKSEDKSEN